MVDILSVTSKVYMSGDVIRIEGMWKISPLRGLLQAHHLSDWAWSLVPSAAEGQEAVLRDARQWARIR